MRPPHYSIVSTAYCYFSRSTWFLGVFKTFVALVTISRFPSLPFASLSALRLDDQTYTQSQFGGSSKDLDQIGGGSGCQAGEG